MTSRFFYFAYGSNLLSARLLERTPSARVVGPAVLPGHRLVWHKAATDGSGKCDVVAAAEPEHRVLGVVYDIALADKPALDAAETLGVGYGERLAQLQAGERTLSAWLYFALKVDPASVPYDWYKALVVHGAREHALDEAYVRALDAVAAKADPDPVRAQRHFALLPRA